MNAHGHANLGQSSVTRWKVAVSHRRITLVKIVCRIWLRTVHRGKYVAPEKRESVSKSKTPQNRVYIMLGMTGREEIGQVVPVACGPILCGREDFRNSGVAKTVTYTWHASPSRTFNRSMIAKLKHRPRLLSDNGPGFVAKALQTYLKRYGIRHIRSAPYHPMTQGKIERWHRSMKNVVKLDTYYYPWELEQSIARFVEYYNNERYHESLDNLRPADVYYGRGETILTWREEIKQMTLRSRKMENLSIAIDTWNAVGQTLP